MRRRETLLGLAAGALLATYGVEAQKANRVYKVGVLTLAAREPAYDDILVEEFRKLGYVLGQNLVLEYRSAEGRTERLAGLAMELVQLKVEVIVALSNIEAAAAKAVTSSIPIVLALGAGPVRAGLVTSLAKPGGNVTGSAADPTPEIVAKQLELLREVVPKMARVAVLWNSASHDYDQYVEALEDASRKLKLSLKRVALDSPDRLDGAFATISSQRAEALCVIADPLTFSLRSRIAALATRQRLPATSFMREFVDAGILMSYGPNLLPPYGRAAFFADRILRRTKPAELPVEQATTFELVLNLKVAKALGITVPRSVRVRVDHLIE